MIKRKYVVIGFLAFCLVSAFLVAATTSWTPPPYPPEYSPWVDSTGPDDISDGKIGWEDLFELAGRYGTTGNPVLIARQGNISIPAAAFVPLSNTADVQNYGYHFKNYEQLAGERWVGSVQLPNGATVTNVTFYWFDITDFGDIMCQLKRYNQTHVQEMAEIWSGGADGYGSSYNATISYATVDESQYAYYIEVEIPKDGHSQYWFQYAVIEYEYQ